MKKKENEFGEKEKNKRGNSDVAIEIFNRHIYLILWSVYDWSHTYIYAMRKRKLLTHGEYKLNPISPNIARRWNLLTITCDMFRPRLKRTKRTRQFERTKDYCEGLSGTHFLRGNAIGITITDTLLNTPFPF
jgi:hypothetical protein